MSDAAEHPDVVPYARYMRLQPEEEARIIEHLKACGDCRDLVLFVRKASATLWQNGRIDRVAKALGITPERVREEMRLGTSIATLIKRPPDAPVPSSAAPVQPVAPAKK